MAFELFFVKLNFDSTSHEMYHWNWWINIAFLTIFATRSKT